LGGFDFDGETMVVLGGVGLHRNERVIATSGIAVRLRT
jgi:hypothetical protein